MPKHRLLLADDSVTIQKVVNLTFADEGIEVITAGDGNTAMQKFVESVPDLVMVDVNMPGFDGYRICEMIKQDEETKQIPVILLVGSFEPFDEAEARRVGADAYLTKPFQSIRQLVSKVTDLLNHTNGENSSAPSSDFVVESGAATMTAASFNDVSATKNEANFELFGGDQFDDEIIQTNQIGSLPTDEMQKFVFEPNLQTPENSFADSENHFAFSGADVNVDANKEDSTETQSFNPHSFEPTPINSTGAEVSPLGEMVYDFADDQPFAPETASDVSEQPKQETADDDKNMMSETDFDSAAQTQNDSFFDFDDLNFLEIPPLTKKPVPEAKPEVPTKSVSENSAVQPVPEIIEPPKPSENADVAPAANFSPEIIEAIAKRVVAELSDKVVREIAREITPQMTESIIREMARKKTN